MTQNSEMNQIINQVKSETRNENLKNFFNKNSRILIVVSFLVVIVAISFFIFDSYQSSKRDKFSAILQQSLLDQQSDQLVKAKKGLKEIIETASAPKNIKALASLRYASLLLDENKNSEAISFYEKVNQCAQCDPYIKDLGGLLIVKVWLSNENEIQKADLLSRIEKIEAGSKELKKLVSEQKAIFEMQRGNLAKSYSIFDSLMKNPESDKTLKERAAKSLKIILAKGYNPSSS